MKVIITPQSIGSQVFDDNGNEIKCVQSITVTASIDHPTRMELKCEALEITHVESEFVEFYVPGIGNIMGFIMADGTPNIILKNPLKNSAAVNRAMAHYHSECAREIDGVPYRGKDNA